MIPELCDTTTEGQSAGTRASGFYRNHAHAESCLGKTEAADPVDVLARRLSRQQSSKLEEATEFEVALKDLSDPVVQKVLRVLRLAGVVHF